MKLVSRNPYTEQLIEERPCDTPGELDGVLDRATVAQRGWRQCSFAVRSAALVSMAEALRRQRGALAQTITQEMGKRLEEAEAEVEKCAVTCDYYAEHGERFLADTPVASDAGRSYVLYQPLGTVLAVMPWNFPLWQVFRFAVPALMAGNAVVLKHSANVPRCADRVVEIAEAAGLPAGVVQRVNAVGEQVLTLVDDRRVAAVTLTGSCEAGRRVAARAGQALKKTVLELGGSDPFVVLDDADIPAAVEVAVMSRFMNAGQSCIAAKRFIVTPGAADPFVDGLIQAVRRLRCGDPLDPATTLAPMARADLRDRLAEQTRRSIALGATERFRSDIPGHGFFHPAVVLDEVKPGMPACSEELFGPVAAVIRAGSEQDAMRLANDTVFGLGASVWTADVGRAQRFAREFEAGVVFVNGLVKSDPRLPFGGIKDSGYGRELSFLGITEFTNAKTVWIK